MDLITGKVLIPQWRLFLYSHHGGLCMFSISRVKMGWTTILATTLLAAAAAAQTASASKAKEAPDAKTEQATKVQEPSAFKTPKEKQSYAIGMDLGSQLRRMSIDEDPDVFSKGLKDRDRKSTRLNSSHVAISYAVFCLKNKTFRCQCYDH